MDIDYQKYEVERDKLDALNALLKVQKERAEDFHRDCAELELTIHRSMYGCVSRATLDDLQLSSRDTGGFLKHLRENPEKLAKITRRNGDPIAMAVGQYVALKASLAAANERLAVTKERQFAAQHTVNRMAEFIDNVTSTDRRPRIL